MMVQPRRIGDLLLEEGVITQQDLERALARQKVDKKRLGTLLKEMGIITEAKLIEVLEQHLGVEFIDLSQVTLPAELVRVVPRNIAKAHGVIPVRVDKGQIFLAMSDPLNFVAIEEVKRVTHKRVIPMIATEEAIDRAIQSLYGVAGAAQAIEEMTLEARSAPRMNEAEQTISADGEGRSAPTVRLVSSIIERAATEQASDIHLEPREEGMVVRIRVDGVLRTLLKIPGNLQASVISRLKVMSGMDTAERRVPQNGRARMRIKQKSIDLRLSTIPTFYGEKVVIRLLDPTTQMTTVADLGLDACDTRLFEKLMRSVSGVILIAGPTGSGKSSTMSTMVRALNTDAVNIITLEDPVEYNIDGVNQCQINEKTGMTFSSGLRAILRQDPDIISVGEIRDGETAEIAMRAAITGHLLLSTIHTSDAVSVLDRLEDVGVPTYLTVSALKGVVAQRLVRKICPQCRESYAPTDEELTLLQMKRTDNMTFYRGKGCPMCGHTGYKGRTGVFEILLADQELRTLISERAPRDAILAHAKRNGLRTISDRCRQLVQEGVTTVEEASRTIYSTLD